MSLLKLSLAALAGGLAGRLTAPQPEAPQSPLCRFFATPTIVRDGTAIAQMRSGRACWKFASTPSLLDALSFAAPAFERVDLLPADEVPESERVDGRNLSWNLDKADFVVKIPVEYVQFEPENIWFFSHARGLFETAVKEAVAFDLPVVSLHRIDAYEVEESREFYDEGEGELEYQTGLGVPWEEADVGHFEVKLLNGNHRALAAMALGEDFIVARVSPNFRENVLPGEWIKKR